ncbi:MAG: Uma2 family endonuclease [Chloroflexi bacterium]|nr:Uma2 family endonuclease [Chloroflexota bacterium]
MAVEVARRLISVDEFVHLIETGFFGPEERVELIHGEMIAMPPIGDGRVGHTNHVNFSFNRLFAGRAVVAVQNPIVLPGLSRPQPDVAVLRPRPDFYGRSTATPSDVLTLVEVADTTLTYDRDTKGPMYAAAGIVEYWIINVAAGEVIVHRQPTPTGYASVTTLRRGDTVTPVMFPDVPVAISDLLI